MIHKVVVPNLEATGGEVTLLEWLVQVGDFIKVGTPMFVAETDKATMDVESFEGGYLRQILVSEGETMEAGTEVAVLTDDPDEPLNQGSSDNSQLAASEKEKFQTESKDHAAPPPPPSQRVRASPAAKRLAGELDIDLTTLKNGGRQGEIRKEDVLAAARSKSQAGEEEGCPTEVESQVRRVSLSPMRRAIAKRTQRSANEIPQFHVSIDIEMDDVIRFRQLAITAAKINGWVSPTLTDIVIAATALALRRVPQLNASYRDEEILIYDDIHVGLVVDVTDGLLVPVLHHPDQQDLYTLAATTQCLKEQAARGKVKQADLSGATFTVSNLGMFGVDHFVAVVNPPEAGILAVGAVRPRAVVENGKVVPREMMSATLTVDHRLVDGTTAAQFLKQFRELLAKPGWLIESGGRGR